MCVRRWTLLTGPSVRSHSPQRCHQVCGTLSTVSTLIVTLWWTLTLVWWSASLMLSDTSESSCCIWWIGWLAGSLVSWEWCMSTLHTSSFCLLHFTVFGVIALFQHAWYHACECCIDYLCQCVCVHACVRVCVCVRVCLHMYGSVCFCMCVWEPKVSYGSITMMIMRCNFSGACPLRWLRSVYWG